MADDFYSALGVSRDASQEEIQKAYLKQARKYHPDMNPDNPEAAKKKFQEVQKAFETLKDPEKRRQYDQFGANYDQFGGAGGPFGGGAGGPFGGFSWNGSAGADANINIEDLFQGMFGGGGGFGGRGRRRSRPAKGENVATQFEISFQTAVQGGSAPLAWRDPQTGAMKSLDVKIPVGVETGKKIRLRGLGKPGVNGGENGDLILEIVVGKHPFYSRDGQNLRVRVPVTLREAVFGAKIDVPTPVGVVAVKIPAGTTSGAKLRLKGLGLPAATSGGAQGDLFVECEVQLPQTWSPKDLELLQKLETPEPTVRERLHF
ncbi:MAG: J domain-containing protein [Thermoguttaceae bacterium]|nr:J domain-containing protein [Thermoguttaceae bacterium]